MTEVIAYTLGSVSERLGEVLMRCSELDTEDRVGGCMSGTDRDELQRLRGDRCGRVWLTRGQQANPEVAIKPRDQGQRICEHRGF